MKYIYSITQVILFLLLTSGSQPLMAQGSPGLGSTLYSLLPGEEFVFGEIGKTDQGTIKYTVCIVRKSNAEKEVYEFYGSYYGPRPIGANMVKDRMQQPHNKYDYWLIFNDKKFGPYDHIFSMEGKMNIDEWVSEDGAKISFCGTRGKQWHPVIGNISSSYYWSPGQKPEYTFINEKWAFAMQWSQNVYKLFENGIPVVKSARFIESPVYSKKGNLIYSMAPNNMNEHYVYHNHQQVGGPFNVTGDFGFIPGTEQYYYNGYSQVVIGQKEYICKPNETVNSFQLNDSYIVFKILDKKSRLNTIYEYNIATGQMSSHGPYANNLYVRKNKSNIVYCLEHEDTRRLEVIDVGGQKSWSKKHVIGDYESPRYKLSPKGDMYVWYKTQKGGNWIIERNGTVIKSNTKAAQIWPVAFDAYTDKPLFHVNVDESIGGVEHRLIEGDTEYQITGDLNGGQVFAQNGNSDVYYTLRTINGKIWTYQLFKNGIAIDNKEYDEIRVLETSPDGNQFIFLEGGDYFIDNEKMHKGWKIYHNGQVLQGKFGIPVYLSSKDAFVVIKENDRKLVLDTL